MPSVDEIMNGRPTRDVAVELAADRKSEDARDAAEAARQSIDGVENDTLEGVVLGVLSGSREDAEEVRVQRRRSGMKLHDRLSELAKEKKRISFIVHTPGTEHARPYHSVQMKDFYVKTTEAGNRIVLGRDLEQELAADFAANRRIAPGGHRKKSEKVFRNYRLDRIVPRSLIACI